MSRLHSVRRHSTRTQASQYREFHRAIPRLFAGQVPGCSPDSTSSSDEDDGTDLQAKVISYKRSMHAHTKSQMSAPPDRTLPSYTRALHAYTQNQMNHLENQRASSTVVSSVGAGAKAAALPQSVCPQIVSLRMDERPYGPASTPEPPCRNGEEAEKMEQTQGRPDGIRGIAATTPVCRDFAAVAVS